MHNEFEALLNKDSTLEDWADWLATVMDKYVGDVCACLLPCGTCIVSIPIWDARVDAQLLAKCLNTCVECVTDAQILVRCSLAHTKSLTVHPALSELDENRSRSQTIMARRLGGSS